MATLYTCITGQHQGWMVGLAACICALGVWATFALGREVLRTRDRLARRVWAGAACVATASAIWATHFISMVAYAPGLPFCFALAGTVLSFLIALALVAAAGALILRWPGLAGRLAGGSLVGLAIAAMHYTGMRAMQVQGEMRWNPGTVAVSVLCAIGLAVLAAVLPLCRARGLRRLAPPALMLAVCSAHFIGMSAVTLVYDPVAAEPAGAVDLIVLTLLVANVALLIVGLSLAALWLQGRERRRHLAEKRRLQDLADIAVEGLLICDGPHVIGLNHSLAAMTGWTAADLAGRSVDGLLPDFDGWQAVDGQERDALLRTRTGEGVPVRVVSKPIALRGRPQTVLAIRDQRDRLKIEADMLRLAHRDPLTGLANRLSFGEAVTARCARRRRSEGAFALLMLDLDRFKAVNDMLGHTTGDEVLRGVADRLLAAARTGDLVARLGGDEFAVLLDPVASTQEVMEIAERMMEAIARPFPVGAQMPDLGTSIGIALAPGDGDTLEVLARHADLALSRAKTEGRGACRFFEAVMDDQMRDRRAFEADLRHATAHHQFEVVYQPQVDAATGGFTGAEALVRWNHPRRGPVSPAEFIPLAEELGLIDAIGRQVLRAACAEAARWPDHLAVAVNVSPVQLRDREFAATVAGILAETGVPGYRLELELTETALIEDEGETVALLHALRMLGIRVSLDDFGTGYSSLSYLRRFPFDKLKIDQSFVRQLPDDADSVAIVQAVATLGTKLGMIVTAEGVETEEQRGFVTGEGCHQLQGYLISRPLPAARVADLFAGCGVPAAVAA